MATAPTREDLARQIIDCCLAMNARGINQGSAGNVSVRFDDGFLITPSGIAYERLQPEHIVLVDLDGKCADRLRPSSEWRMHRDIYAHRPEAGAVLHAHSIFATALSCLRIGIPAREALNDVGILDSEHAAGHIQQHAARLQQRPQRVQHPVLCRRQSFEIGVPP